MGLKEYKNVCTSIKNSPTIPKSMVLYLVTGNEGKAREFSAILGTTVEILPLKLRKEIQGTPEEIALTKLEDVFEQPELQLVRLEVSTNVGVIVDDVSFPMKALYGLPGPYIKSFLEPPEGEDPDRGIQLLCDIARWSGKRDVRAICTLGYATSPKDKRIFQGVANGIIVPPRGTNGFGWDRIFQPEGYSQTYAEMTLEEKNKISHRAKAVEQLREYLIIEDDFRRQRI